MATLNTLRRFSSAKNEIAPPDRKVSDLQRTAELGHRLNIVSIHVV